MPDRLPAIQHSRQPQDTALWCIERADADRATAAASDNDNVRERFERSAASWSERAEMLARVDARSRARTAAARAQRDQEDVPLRAALRGAIVASQRADTEDNQADSR